MAWSLDDASSCTVEYDCREPRRSFYCCLTLDDDRGAAYESRDPDADEQGH
jgi:hypothetical protein